jgi:peptidoglycan L-alanyl-D-glutamate endopeptidase CwlK
MPWLKKLNKGHIHPGLVRVMERVLAKLEAANRPFKVYSGLRTFKEQNELYAQGRTKGTMGVVITKAKGGQSMHNYGLAVDLAPLNLLTEDPDDLWWPNPDQREGQVWTDLHHALHLAIRDIVLEDKLDDGLEYEWGGRWKFRDVPHCQVRTTLAELYAGHYPYCADVEWLVMAHTTFLFDTPWMNRRVQHLLNMQSYDAGAVDGVFGRQSTAAMNKFQRDQHLGDGTLEGPGLNRPLVERLVRLHQAAMSTLRGTLPEDLVG